MIENLGSNDETRGQASVEARLSTITTTPPPAELRQRVLAAVDAVLTEPPADLGHEATQWFLLATAVAATLLVFSWGGGLRLGRSVAATVPSQPVTLNARVCSVGIQLDPLSQP